MSSFENLVEEIRILEDRFANCLANNASNVELTAIFKQIKVLKEKLNITCHSQLTVTVEIDKSNGSSIKELSLISYPKQ